MTDAVEYSVKILRHKCTGCTTCSRACPTCAIRIRDRKAVILKERCIDCGTCIRVCPEQAAVARTDTLDAIRKYKYKIALPGPELYGQFGNDVTPGEILEAFLDIGFDEVHEIAVECEEMTYALQNCVTASMRKRPIISFTCPAVVRLIATRYPSLLDHVSTIRSPMGVAAKRLRETRPKELGIDDSDLGLFYITPCPARVTRVRRPMTDHRVYYSGAIAVSEVYGPLQSAIRRNKHEGKGSDSTLFRSNGTGIAWGAAGGEVQAIGREDCLYVYGMPNVLDIFEEIDQDELADLDYLEVMGCTGGCVGGPLMVDNVSLARNKIRKLARRYSAREETIQPEVAYRRNEAGEYDQEVKLELNLIDPLDSDPQIAIRKLKSRNQILETLPGIDCGACGAPTCKTLAEDIVQGRAERTDCVFVLFEQAHRMARQVADWTAKLPTGGSKKDAEEPAASRRLKKVEP